VPEETPTACLCASVLGDCRFEGVELRAEAEAAAAQTLRDGGDFRVGNVLEPKEGFSLLRNGALDEELATERRSREISAIVSEAAPSP